MKTTTSGNDLRTALSKAGAREYEIVALSMDPNRGLAALAAAHEKNAEHPVAYAIKLFDNPEWQPRGEKKTPIVNAAVQVKCGTCGGDRFVFVTDDPNSLYGETVKPCPTCNANCDAGFWKANGERFEVAK